MENKTEYLGNAKSVFDGNKIEVNFKVEELINAIEKLRSKQTHEQSEKKRTQLDSLIKAQKGRINKLNSKIEEKLIRINDLSSFTEEYADITAIILDIK